MPKPFTSDVYIPQFLDSDDRAALIKRMSKGKIAPLYVYRSIVNAQDLIDWAREQGFTSITAPEDLHVTVIYSRNSVDWFKLGENWSGDLQTGNMTVNPGGPRAVEALGDKGAVVLMFASSALSYRNQSATDIGCSWDYDEYQPHITITYNAGDIDPSTVEPYSGKIILGPEMFEPLDPGWRPQEDDMTGDAPIGKRIYKVATVDDGLGLVFGWAIVSTVDGLPYDDWNVDPDGELVPEHIPDATMLKASAKFMEGNRPGNEMHAGPDIGTYVFGFPLTADIAKAMGISCDKTGFMVGYKPNNPEVLRKFKTGEFSGFSIEGSRIDYTEEEY